MSETAERPHLLSKDCWCNPVVIDYGTETEVQDKKFIVFKREQFEEWEASVATRSDLWLPPSPVEDAVVIRRQDVFAPPALDAYASAILCVIETLKVQRDRMQTGVAKLEIHQDIERLQAIADYFHGQANVAWSTKRKLPD